MKLSVVIVNYNVRLLLEECIKSVEKALDGIEGDIFVIDNNSSDGSVEYIRERFRSLARVKLPRNLAGLCLHRGWHFLRCWGLPVDII